MISKKRFKQWLILVFGKNIGIKQWYKIFRASLRLLMNDKVSRTTWRHRMRTCTNCPLYDVVQKVCRPPERPDLGCGCYTPYLAIVKENDCWGNKTYDGFPGWKI